MNQPTPTVGPEDVERVVRRDYPAERVAEVMAMLQEYGAGEHHREVDRVRLAALKLAAGNLERLRYEVEGAKMDYRDVLAPAEYPEYSRRWFRIDPVSSPERDRIIERDWRQYQEWLSKP